MTDQGIINNQEKTILRQNVQSAELKRDNDRLRNMHRNDQRHIGKLQAQLDAWRAAIAEAAAAAAAVPAAEAAVPEPPAEETAFSMNVTCARAHADWTRSLSPHRRPAARALVAAGLLPSVGGSKTQTCAARSALYCRGGRY